MCEALTMCPRAIYPSDLSDKQLRALHRINKSNILSAWRTSEGFTVYLDSAKPNCYFWKKCLWVEVKEEEHG